VAVTAAVSLSCSRGDSSPVVVVTAVPSANAAACARFAARLPKDLGTELPRRRTEPEDPHVAAYGNPPIVIRCGAPLRGTYQPGDPLLNVNGVSWAYEERKDAGVWTLPRSFVNVEVTIPDVWTGDRLARLADAVKAAQNGG
jgi:hypothetical protein